jgi:hypothetical protein
MVYVVERYLPGLIRSDLLRGLARLEQAAGAEQHEVRYLGSTIVLEDEACFCRFEGPSEAAVAEANRQAGLPFDRITPAVTVTPTERRAEMEISTPAPPRTVRISRSRLVAMVVAAAAAAAALTGVVVALTVGGGSTPTAKVLSPELRANVSNVPLIPRIAARGSDYVRAITSMTPVQLVEAFGTDVNAAVALSSLTPKERQHVEAIMTLTPAQLRAAFGTDIEAAGVLASLTPAERGYVKSIMALTPAQLRAAFGTGK